MRLPAVLSYHKIGTPELGGTWCTRRRLAAHLEALERAGFAALHPLPFEDRVRSCLEGAETAAHDLAARGLPAREFLMTFDDAFASFATHAWPELERRRVPVLLFVPSEFVGRRSTWDLALPGRRVPHLDWPALIDLARAGVVIGSHGATHRDLRRLDDAELERELHGSRRTLEDRLGCDVASVAYPFGCADRRVRGAAQRAGYRLGFSMCPPRRAEVDPLLLRRWGVYFIDGPASVLDKVDPSRRLHAFQGLLVWGINACARLVAARSARRPGSLGEDRA